MPVRRVTGLSVIVVTDDAARFHAALSIAAASAALGERARVYLHGDAVALATGPDGPDDARYAAGGLSTLCQMLAEALALGVRLTVCQSGLALSGMDATTLDPRIESGGLVSFLGSLGEDRLTTV